MIIRHAEIEDASGIARVHVDAWRTTYKNIIPSDFLNTLKYEDKERQWTHNIHDDSQFIIVAEADGQIIGYAAADIRTHKGTNTHHLDSIYILNEFQGTGLGRQLLHEIFYTLIQFMRTLSM